jgi:glycosyltransferase involved in cell wall biosynthesis
VEQEVHFMHAKRHINVAVLLATYNGSQYVDHQIRSLKDNETPFTLHWLDDHSTDNTREVVRSSARIAGVPITEWHQPQRQDIPGSFFKLLECVEADIYLFCDQDDIWFPGKIDATVANLAPDMGQPVLCSSDFLQFNDHGGTGNAPSLSGFIGDQRLKGPPVFLMLMRALSFALTQGFTRPLREIYLKHKAIAGEYAMSHDCWMYDIAIASGTARLISNEPTVLRRLHGKNSSLRYGRQDRNPIKRKWRSAQLFRNYASRHAQGFLLATPTLPSGQHLNRLRQLAQLIATIDRRQSPRALVRLAGLGVTPWWNPGWFSVACLCSDATPPVTTLPVAMPASSAK